MRVCMCMCVGACMQILHIVWFVMIASMIARSFVDGGVHRDFRSDSENDGPIDASVPVHHDPMPLKLGTGKQRPDRDADVCG